MAGVNNIGNLITSNGGSVDAAGSLFSGLGGMFTGGLSSFLPGALGALGGLFGNSTSKKMDIQGPSATGLAGEQAVLQNLSSLQNYTNLGPGASDVTAGVNSQRSLADMLQSYSKGGFLPGQEDFATANQFASSAFAPQQTAINQQFTEQQQRTAQLAAQLGRPVNDPILQAKLSQERAQAQERLGASQSAFVSDFAQKLPQQRLGYMGQLADVRQGLASQAMQNRQALIGIGSNLQQMDNQFRLGSAGVSMQQGGGLQGAIAGGFAGYGAGLRNQALSNQNDFYRTQMNNRSTNLNVGVGIPGAANIFTPPINATPNIPWAGQQQSQSMPNIFNPLAGNPYEMNNMINNSKNQIYSAPTYQQPSWMSGSMYGNPLGWSQ